MDVQKPPKQQLIESLKELFPDRTPAWRAQAILAIEQLQEYTAAGVVTFDEADKRALIEAAVTDRATAGAQGAGAAGEILRSAPWEDLDKWVARMEAIDRQRAPFETAMQPVQVGFIANSPANALGGVMATSRWRVCGALWTQLAVFVAVLLIYLLGSMTGLVSWMLGLGALFLWWLGVFRDHQKDDLGYLQRHIQLASYVRMQQKAANSLTVLNVPSEHPAWRYTDTTSGFGPLLLAMVQREQQLCKRFRMSVVEEVSAEC